MLMVLASLMGTPDGISGPLLQDRMKLRLNPMLTALVPTSIKQSMPVSLQLMLEMTISVTQVAVVAMRVVIFTAATLCGMALVVGL